MKAGIVGFARSGKTTVFNAITGATAEVGVYGHRDANIAVIKVPDARVDRLAEIFKPRKKTFAEFEFVDIAPTDNGDRQKALDSAALTQLKNTDALIHVVRAFGNENVMHPFAAVAPARDVDALEQELQLDDLIIVEKRLDRLEKEHKKDREHDLLLRCKAHVEKGLALRSLELSHQEDLMLRGFTFLSRKPMMLLGNYGEDKIGAVNPAGLSEAAAQQGLDLIELCGEMELEVSQLPPDEQQAFRSALGLGMDSRLRFIHVAYERLGLISFLTVGETEVRAWTVPRGTHAVDAAGAVHSDIQRGFIRAETVAYEDFMAAGSMAKAKEKGKVRLEGKDYPVKDGDIILFRFNV